MKFRGKIGYAETVERPEGSGIAEDVITERTLNGDVNRWSRALREGSTSVNDNLEIQMEFSLIADAYARDNFDAIRYIVWKGRRWTVSNIAYQQPRLIVNVGGVYRGPTPIEAPQSS